MSERFDDFMKPLKETHFSLKDYVDFPKVAENVEAISIKLNQLNYLIGQEDMGKAVKRLWDENPKVFTVLDVLIVVRTIDRKKAIDSTGNIHLITDYFKSPEQVRTPMFERYYRNVMGGPCWDSDLAIFNYVLIPMQERPTT